MNNFLVKKQSYLNVSFCFFVTLFSIYFVLPPFSLIILFFYFLQVGNTAVIWAVSRRQKNVLGQLVDLGADLNVQENVRIYYNKINKKDKNKNRHKNKNTIKK